MKLKKTERIMNKKAYIQPELKQKKFISTLMQATSVPQSDDEIGEDDELSKGREKGFDGWGSLW